MGEPGLPPRLHEPVDGRRPGSAAGHPLGLGAGAGAERGEADAGGRRRPRPALPDGGWRDPLRPGGGAGDRPAAPEQRAVPGPVGARRDAPRGPGREHRQEGPAQPGPAGGAGLLGLAGDLLRDRPARRRALPDVVHGPVGHHRLRRLLLCGKRRRHHLGAPQPRPVRVSRQPRQQHLRARRDPAARAADPQRPADAQSLGRQGRARGRSRPALQDGAQLAVRARRQAVLLAAVLARRHPLDARRSAPRGDRPDPVHARRARHGRVDGGQRVLPRRAGTGRGAALEDLRAGRRPHRAGRRGTGRRGRAQPGRRALDRRLGPAGARPARRQLRRGSPAERLAVPGVLPGRSRCLAGEPLLRRRVDRQPRRLPLRARRGRPEADRARRDGRVGRAVRLQRQHAGHRRR